MAAELLLAFGIGLASLISPCVLPLYAGFLAFLAGSGEGRPGWRTGSLGFWILLGVLMMMLALGLILATLSVAVSRAMVFLLPLSSLVIAAMGLLLLAGWNVFARLPHLPVPVMKNPRAGAFVYGLLYGPVVLPCSGAYVVSLFALATTAGQLGSRLLVFLAFGLGLGLPLLGLSFLAGARQHQITDFLVRRAALINRVAGIAMVGVGLWLFWNNWEFLMISIR